MNGAIPRTWSTGFSHKSLEMCTKCPTFQCAMFHSIRLIKIKLLGNGVLGNFKISGENQHWSRQLTFWRNFPYCDLLRGSLRVSFL